MATMREIKTHKSVVRSHDSLVYLQVGRATTQALDIYTPFVGFDIEGLKGTSLTCQLDSVDVLVSTIVSRTGIAL